MSAEGRMDASDYQAEVQDRLATGGYAVSVEELSGVSTLVGYRSDFRWSWFATKLHLFVAVQSVPVVSRDTVSNLASHGLVYAKQTKGRIRGLQSGVAVIAAVVSPRVDEDARTFAELEMVRQFGAFAWPVIVDLVEGDVVSQKGAPVVGAVYNKWMREQIAAVLPRPKNP